MFRISRSCSAPFANKIPAFSRAPGKRESVLFRLDRKTIATTRQRKRRREEERWAFERKTGQQSAEERVYVLKTPLSVILVRLGNLRILRVGAALFLPRVSHRSRRISLYFLWELDQAYLVPEYFAALTTNPSKIITRIVLGIVRFAILVSLHRKIRSGG